MKRLLTAGGVALLLAGCIDFDASRLEFCKSLAPLDRARICLDGPQVLTRSPGPGLTGIAWNVHPAATFDQQVTCGPSGLTLVEYVSHADVAGGTVCAGDQATFTALNDLSSGLVYLVTITADVKNDAGVPFFGDAGSWTFMTR